MPLAYELTLGDVVVYDQGDVRTVSSARAAGVDQYPLTSVTWSDGRTSLCRSDRSFVRVWPRPPSAAPDD